MATRNLPGSEASRHGTGDADLTIMLGAHAAFRRDLVHLARAAAFADLPDPARRTAVQVGWEVFKRQLHLHHTAEDAVVWPALRNRLGHSEHAMSVLDAMEAEHKQIDPLLAAVDEAFGDPRPRGLADVTDALAMSLTGHLSHEEREMFAWIADGADPDQAAAVVGTLPPPARLIYRAIWKPRYQRTPRW
jgi:iron-sulfur cluster repair protein YtfE (RIC family)